MFDKQTKKFCSAIVDALPEVSEDTMQGWIMNPKGLQKVLRDGLCPSEVVPNFTVHVDRQQARRPFPAVGEVFELTANEQITGLDLLENFGYNHECWGSTAETILAGTTRRFKLVPVGYFSHLTDVLNACKGQGGKNTNGCWLKVFNEAFGAHSQNSVGVPDISWVNSYGLVHFPAVTPNGRRDLFFLGDLGRRFSVRLWLVEV